jgi:hypothetical protein
MSKRTVSRQVIWAGRSLLTAELLTAELLTAELLTAELLTAGLLAIGLVACSSGGGESTPSADARFAGPEVIAPEGTPADSREVNYQFVGTADGMTVEAISGDQVQTLSCPTRTCAGLCDECAAAACRAVGELAAACERLTADCSRSCACSGVGSDGLNCGFPVCATNRNLCYIGEGEAAQSGFPGGPVTDPSPEESPTSRPSSASEAGSSSGSGANTTPGAG